MDDKEYKKALVKKQHLIAELAGQIHDVVEDTLWTEYTELPHLSKKMQLLMAEFEAMKASSSVSAQ